MADLIDREALMADIAETVVFSGRNSRNAEIHGANKIIDRIKAAPTVDAVEVVRCKDCVSHNICKFEQFQGLNGFCSYGERKCNGK